MTKGFISINPDQVREIHDLILQSPCRRTMTWKMPWWT